MYNVDTYDHLVDEAGVAPFSTSCESFEELKAVAQEVVDYGLSLSEVHVQKYEPSGDPNIPDFESLGSLDEVLVEVDAENDKH